VRVLRMGVNALIHSLQTQPSNARAHQTSFLRHSYLVAASQPRQTPSSTPARTHSQQTHQIEHPNAYWRQYASETSARDHSTSTSHRHAPLFAVSSPTTGSTSLSRLIALVTTCGDTAAEKQTGRASTAKQVGVSTRKGRCCETPGGVYVGTAYQD
jgi:hypothetical protein